VKELKKNSLREPEPAFQQRVPVQQLVPEQELVSP
jgi:hypothetical protein